MLGNGTLSCGERVVDVGCSREKSDPKSRIPAKTTTRSCSGRDGSSGEGREGLFVEEDLRLEGVEGVDIANCQCVVENEYACQNVSARDLDPQTCSGRKLLGLHELK